METLRQWMIEDGLWQPKRQRRKRPFQLRERRACVGELVQIDGSPHDWLEQRGPRCTLIAFIDDASGRLQYAHFVPAETSRDYLLGLRSYVARYGRPLALYSDRHSIFTKHDPEDPQPTQFERAARALLSEGEPPCQPPERQDRKCTRIPGDGSHPQPAQERRRVGRRCRDSRQQLTTARADRWPVSAKDRKYLAPPHLRQM